MIVGLFDLTQHFHLLSPHIPLALVEGVEHYLNSMGDPGAHCFPAQIVSLFIDLVQSEQPQQAVAARQSAMMAVLVGCWQTNSSNRRFT